ncbi:MAG: hypothetical protein ACI8QD_002324 [Cyclobacteriaceae bacterium]|jgi:hypothetical protein
MSLLTLLALMIWSQPLQDYCEIYGSFYEVEDILEADLVVYLEGAETFADIIVYEQKNRLYADKPGMWYFESDAVNARRKVFFTDRKREAHFSIYLSRFESFAGCNR